MKNLFKILFLMIFFTSCTENVVEAIYGCFDSEACNYNPFATFDNNSCEFESCKDCAGVQFGEAKEDDCGICFGDNTYCLPIELSFGNIYTNEQEQTEVELLIDTPQDLTGFQFDLENAEILNADGGLWQDYDFEVFLNFSDTLLYTRIISFNLQQNAIPQGSSNILTKLILNPLSEQLCLENAAIVKSIEGIPTFEDINDNKRWDDGEECFYDDTEHHCDGTQLILENWNDLIDEYGIERTLEELYDRSDGFDEDVISYTVNLGDCIAIPVLN